MSEELVGRKLGQYTVTEFLDTGGMAEVYIAHQASMERDVAIKVIRSDFANDEQFVARFRREASVIAQLEHPHILPVIDFGQEESIVYIVMRLVRGESLDHRLRHGKLKISYAVEMIQKVGSALGFAHEQGIIHRDLKPNNILLDEHGNPYLTDFGIAKLLAGDTKLTGTQGVLGTPSYMAPEQWRNDQIDARADIYSLGIMLYEMLTGNLPFNSATPYQMMYQHVNEQPPPLRKFDANLPPDLEDIVLKALSKKPEERYQTVQEMIETVNTAYHGHMATTNIMAQQVDSDATMVQTGDLKTPLTSQTIDPDKTFIESTPTAASSRTEASPQGNSAEAVTMPPRDSITLNIPKKNTYLVGGLVGIFTVIALIVGLILVFSGDDGDDDPPINEAPSLTILAQRASVRSGPDEVFSIVAQVERDSEFEIEAVNPDRTWYQIMIAGQPGWVPAEMVRTSGSDRIAIVNIDIPTEEPTVSPSDVPEVTPTATISASDIPPSATPSPTEVIIPTVVAMSEPVVDTFDSIATLNWDRNESNRYLQEGRYHTVALPNEQGSGLAMAQGMPPVDDFRLEIELEDLSETSSTVIYGIVFRVQDSGNYYRFAVTSDGQAGLFKRINSQEEALPFTTIYNWDNNVKQHQLKVEMVGSEMVLYVDERVVLRYFDNAISDSGGIGLVAFRQGAHVAWDNLEVEPITHLSDPLSLATSTYMDDFEDNDCQWVDDQSRQIAYLEDGTYHLEVPEDDLGIQIRCATLGWYQNVRIETTAQVLSEGEGTYGVVFRQSADGLNYYRVAVASVGQVVLQKSLASDPDCQPCTVAMEPLPGYDPNMLHRLIVEVVDDQFRVYLDRELVMEAEDDGTVIDDPGEFRFGAYLRGTHVVFDDLILRPIPQFTTVEEDVEESALPDIAATILDESEARFIFSRENIAVNIGADTETPASLVEIPLDEPLTNFVVEATLTFETGAPDDQCGIVYRADLENSAFQWVDLTSSNFLAFGDAQSAPANPTFIGQLGDAPLEQVELLVIGHGENITVVLDGEILELETPVVDDDPVAGDLYLWVYLSALHESTCQFENVQVWSLD